MIRPNLSDYLNTSQGKRPVPIIAESLADLETPLSAYWKLAHDRSDSFLLESVTGGEQVARYSFIGARPTKVTRIKNGLRTTTTAQSTQTEPLKPHEDPLDHIKSLLHSLDPELAESLPRLIGGVVGLISYDYVRTIEKLPDNNPDDLQIDDVALLHCNAVVVFDHAKNRILTIVIADGSEQAYNQAIQDIEWIQNRLNGPLPPLPNTTGPLHPVTANVSQDQFESSVKKIVDYVEAGDGIQMVPSIRFETRVDAHPVTVYRALRSLNPSPFMYLLRFEGLDIVGASPELLVGLEKGEAHVRPIAGTRPRGQNPSEDEALAEELLQDEKERAEHIMLVDLGRNDLGRVCEFGSVKVDDLMIVERYSHVMHIVSDVSGRLRPGTDAIDLLRATFPAGTLSGAPKVRAMQIIDELESTRRGLYGGAVGFFSDNGDAELAIAIRTIVIKDGKAYIQAGAGITYDSNPTKEYEECHNKARAALRAIEIAQQGL